MDQRIAEDILRRTRDGYRFAESEPAVVRERLCGSEIERFADYVREGEKVLDVGCGGAAAFARFQAKRVRYAGVDVSERRIAEAREKWKGTGAEFTIGDLLELPVAESAFDAALAVGVLHHVPSGALRLKALGELARALRPGGHLLIVNWNLWRPRYWHALLHQGFGWRNGWEWGDLLIGWRKPGFARFYHAFRQRELGALCAEAGLEIVEQYYVKGGEPTSWLHGEHLVTIARKR